MSALSSKLSASLASRTARLIRKNVPEPASAVSAPYIDFSSNDYLSLIKSKELRDLYLSRLQNAPTVFGTGASRIVFNGVEHDALETRLKKFFNGPGALLFNSGFDANASFFSCVPQPGDFVVHDEYIHASIHHGLRGGRAQTVQFEHNSVEALRNALLRVAFGDKAVRNGDSSVFVSVESLYSMEGTLAPLQDISRCVEETFPKGNGHLVVDEAHATGIYGLNGRGVVSMLGLEDKCFARLHTFGKALASTGAVLIVNPLVRDYIINYSRPFIYTTATTHSHIIANDCVVEMLENGRTIPLAEKLLDMSAYTLDVLSKTLSSIDPQIVSLIPEVEHFRSCSPHSKTSTSLPTPIIALLTPAATALSEYLMQHGIKAFAATWPIVPADKGRVRITLRADTTREEVELLAKAVARWASSQRDLGE